MIIQYLNTILSLFNHNNKRIHPPPPNKKNHQKNITTTNDKGLIQYSDTLKVYFGHLLRTVTVRNALLKFLLAFPHSKNFKFACYLGGLVFYLP